MYDIHYHPDDLYQAYKYDVIVSTEVIEHNKDPYNFLKHLVALLKPGGIIVIMTLFHQNDDELFKNWWYRRDETHITFFTEKTLQVLCQLCGLNMLYTDGSRIITFEKV